MAVIGLRRRAPRARAQGGAAISPMLLVWALAVALALAVAAAIFVLPTPLALIPVGVLGAIIAVFGYESLIALSFLGGAGLLPFVDTGGFVVANIPFWALFFAAGCGLMLVAWGVRVLTRRPARPLQPSVLLVLVIGYCLYVVIRLAASQPLTLPSLAAPFVAMPAAALITYLWLSHDEALEGMRGALPLVIAILAAWALAYIAGAAGCEPCRAYVDTGRVRTGVLGSGTRLFTAGQNAFLGLVLFTFGQTLRRFTIPMATVTLLGVAAIALQTSRAQYFGFLAGAMVLLIWKFGRVRIVGRLLLVVATVTGFLALLSTPAGERGLSAFEDVSQQSGTGAVRLVALDQSVESWSIFGLGVYRQILGKGVNFDLGFPNTLIVLGYVGGFLQLAVLVVALLRSATAGTLAGATLAAIFLLVLVARPTLPLVEYGHSAIVYGAALGFAAALHTRGRWRPGPSPAPT